MAITIDGSTGISGVDGSAGTPALQGTDTNTGISFGTDEVNINTGGTSRVTVDSSGQVGVGTTTVSDLLHVRAATTPFVRVDHTTTSSYGAVRFYEDTTLQASFEVLGSSSAKSNAVQFWNFSNAPTIFATNNTERMRITNFGDTWVQSASTESTINAGNNAGAGTSVTLFRGGHTATSITSFTTSFNVFTNGNVTNTNNSYTGISDVKLKENILDAASQWSDVKALQVRKYNFKKETGHETHTQIGLIAQEVEQVSPGLVFETPDRDAEGNDLGTVTKSVNYSVLYMKAVKALQEAMERIETLETEMAAVKAALDAATTLEQEVTS